MAYAPILYRETRIAPAPTSPSSIVHIDTTGRRNNTTNRKRAFDEIAGLDEEGYARKHLATEGSVFFRSSARSPRRFLWRVLEERRVLEVQCVDIVLPRGKTENGGGDNYLTFRVEFKEAIAGNGVAFADPEDVDALEAFVLLSNNELVTVTLKRDLLTRRAVPKEFDAGTCWKSYRSSPLSFRSPYRLMAVGSLELLVSLHDGGLMRLERKKGESGAQWKETIYNEGGLMGTLRGLNPLKRRQSVRYGSLDLAPGALAAMAMSPDGKYVWTVSLDHMLRAWSTRTWKVVLAMDMMNERQEKEGQRPSKNQYLMDAEQGTLLQLIVPPPSAGSKALAKIEDGEKYFVAVHSPKEHQFKIYRVDDRISSIDGAELPSLVDLTEGSRLVPPIDELMNTNIWHLEEFYINAGVQWTGSKIWIRARSGALCRTFVLNFDLFDEDEEIQDMTSFFNDEWNAVDAGALTVENLKETAGYPGDLDFSDALVTPSEKWLKFLFYPNRFSAASLETALHVYRKGRGLSTSAGKFNTAEQPLQERLTSAITTTTKLNRLPNDQPDYDRYQRDIQKQWQVFYALLSHLQGRRHESIGLAFDAEDDLPWNICADFVSPVRSCGQFEVLNEHITLLGTDRESEVLGQFQEQGGNDRSGPLLLAARSFRQGLSASFQEKLRSAAALDALSPMEDDESARLQSLYDRCNFDMEVTDDDYDALARTTESLGGLAEIRDDPLAVLEWIDTDGEMRGVNDGMLLARFGVKFTVATAQETLLNVETVLLDMLTLVTFMAGGLEEDELHEEFRPLEIYDAIMLRLKHNQLLMWLAGNIRPESTEHGEGSPVTLLQDMFIGDWNSFVERKNPRPMAELLTTWSKNWVCGPDLFKNWDGFTGHVMASLIRHKNIDLAVDFSKFLTDHQWSRYLQARLHVATGNYALASAGFHDVAEQMSKLKSVRKIDTPHLLAADEEGSFGHGLSNFYEHVSSLFETLKVYSYVADFSQAALNHLQDKNGSFSRSIKELDKKKSQPDSPAMSRMDDTIEEIRILKIRQTRDDVLNRLFNALLQTGRFQKAYEALSQIDNPPPRSSNLKSLIETCVKQDAVPVLLSLPFADDLAQEADKILLDVAKRTLKSGAGERNTPYYQILYAFRSQRGDFRGAAEILYEHLQILRNSKSLAVHDPEDETLLHAYVLLINTLACCGEADAWMLVEGGVVEGKKRRLVKLEDVRREYTSELDKRSEQIHGRFPLFSGEEDEMDVL